MSISFDTLIGVEATGYWSGSVVCTHVATLRLVSHMSQFSFLRWAQSHMRLHYKKQEPYHLRSLFPRHEIIKHEIGWVGKGSDVEGPKARRENDEFFLTFLQIFKTVFGSLHEPPPARMPLNRVIVFHLLLNQFSFLSQSFSESIFFLKNPGNSQSLREATFSSTFRHLDGCWGRFFIIMLYFYIMFTFLKKGKKEEENFFAHLVTIFLILSSKVTHHHVT